MSSKDSLVERVETCFRKLSGAASDLNAVSDELGKSISELDSALKTLNLGVTVWVDVLGNDDINSGDFWSKELGYAKVSGKWGISLRNVTGNYSEPDEYHQVEEWLFNDAPRSLRLSAIKKIPELLEKLSEAATKTTADIMEELAEAQQVAAVVKKAAAEEEQSRRTRTHVVGRRPGEVK